MNRLFEVDRIRQGHLRLVPKGEKKGKIGAATGEVFETGITLDAPGPSYGRKGVASYR